MESLKIDCLGDEWDGEYAFVTPSTREYRIFRVAAGIGPAEMNEITEAGSIEFGAVIAFAAIYRSGKVTNEPYDEVRRNTLIGRLLDLPMDMLAGIVNSATVDDGTGEGDGDGGVVPPLSEPEDEPSSLESDETSGLDSTISSVT